jgi:hypothetical protein
MSKKQLWLGRGIMWTAFLAICWGTMPLGKQLFSHRIALGIVLLGLYPLACLLAGWMVGRCKRLEFGLLFAVVWLTLWFGPSAWGWIFWGSEIVLVYARSWSSWFMLVYIVHGPFLFLVSWLIGARIRRSSVATL